jgi:hypothetical protein
MSASPLPSVMEGDGLGSHGLSLPLCIELDNNNQGPVKFNLLIISREQVPSYQPSLRGSVKLRQSRLGCSNRIRLVWLIEREDQLNGGNEVSLFRLTKGWFGPRERMTNSFSLLNAQSWYGLVHRGSSQRSSALLFPHCFSYNLKLKEQGSGGEYS